jgi:hypothetical protein
MFSGILVFCDPNEKARADYSRGVLRRIDSHGRLAVLAGQSGSREYEIVWYNGRDDVYGVIMSSRDDLPGPFEGRELLLNCSDAELRIKIGVATEHININLVMFWICMRTEMALGQHENARRSLWFKLVKSPRHDCELALFSDPIHDPLEMGRFGDPYPFNVSDDVQHIFLVPHYFIYNQTNAHENEN